MSQNPRKGDGMLVITRRLGESVTIGQDIEVTLLKSKEGRIRLGIRAPRDLDVSRKDGDGPETTAVDVADPAR
jgi:ribosomal protein S1